MDVIPNVKFALSSMRINWENITTTINTLDSSTSGDNLISSHQVDYVSSVLIPAEAVEKNQEYFLAKGR